MAPEAGEPGFEPGFTVLETARMAINSFPRGRGSIARERPTGPEHLADLEQATDRSAIVLDARDADGYRGEHAPRSDR